MLRRADRARQGGERECRGQGGAASPPKDPHGQQSPGNKGWHNKSQDSCGVLGKSGKGLSPEVHLDGLLADRGGEPLDMGEGREHGSFARYTGCMQSQWTPAQVSIGSYVNWNTSS